MPFKPLPGPRSRPRPPLPGATEIKTKNPIHNHHNRVHTLSTTIPPSPLPSRFTPSSTGVGGRSGGASTTAASPPPPDPSPSTRRWGPRFRLRPHLPPRLPPPPPPGVPASAGWTRYCLIYLSCVGFGFQTMNKRRSTWVGDAYVANRGPFPNPFPFTPPDHLPAPPRCPPCPVQI